MRKRPTGLLLTLLGLAAVVAVVIGVSFATDDDDRRSSQPIVRQDADVDRGGGTVPEGGRSTEGADTGSTTATGPASGAFVGTIRVGGGDLLTTSRPVRELAGQDVQARGVRVTRVVEGEGFLVGEGATSVYVEFGGQVGEDETSQGELPSQGDTVDVDGELRPSPADPQRTLRIPAAIAAAVERRGAYVNASAVR